MNRDLRIARPAITSVDDRGERLFAAGLAIALPVGFSLILVQLVMAMLARSAPAMNLFSVGMPAAILAGLVLLAIAAPTMGEGIIAAIERAQAAYQYDVALAQLLEISGQMNRYPDYVKQADKVIPP